MEEQKRINNVVFLMKDDQILLAMKKVRFGAGKWNGLGGKPNTGETMSQAAVREVFEESGVKIKAKDLEKRAIIEFHSPVFGDVETHVYRIYTWNGEAQETEEMAPQWFNISEIPYEAMWSTDKVWIPKVIAGDIFRGEVWFDEQDETERSEFALTTVEDLLAQRG